MCTRALFVVSLLALCDAQTAIEPPMLPTLAPSDEATPCGAAFDNARNQTHLCLSNAFNATYHGAITNEQYLNMVCTTCKDGFETTLAAENAAKGCTNASSSITAQTAVVKAVLTSVCVASKSFKYGKSAAIGLGIGGLICLCCICACCIGIIMKLAGGKKKKRGSNDDEADEEEEEEEELE